ncbi:MAG TPA: IPT/TIG domain-containing protein, partial [Thermoanaerobaculia bacterium]
MSRRTFAVLFFAAVLSFPLFGAYTIAPPAGPSTGGTEVTISGTFGSGTHEVYFGAEKASNVRRINAQTLLAVTPSHLPGTSAVSVFESGTFVSTNLVYTFSGSVPAAYERLLVPIFLEPVYGQFGSQFVTSFTARNTGEAALNLYGFDLACPLAGCLYRPLIDSPITLTNDFRTLEDNSNVLKNGNPGRFIYVQKNRLRDVAMNLRVYDLSRSDENYGTEIPIVRERDFVTDYAPLTLLNVPTGPKFRNTLRIYGDGPIRVTVRVEAEGIPPADYDVDLKEGADIFS